MPVYSGSWLDRVFIQLQAASTPRTINNTSGTWTNTGAVLLRHQSLSMTQNKPVAVTPYKTGNRSTLIGLAGRRSGTCSVTFPLVPNGAAGVVPDCDQILAATFGQAATIVASTSATYSFLDSGFLPMAIFRYNLSGGSSPTNFFAGGALVQRLTINMGGDYLTVTAEFKCVFISDSTQFSSYTGVDATAAFGLSTYPAIPGTTTVNGSPINGFGGTMTFDGNSEVDLRGAPSIVISTGLDFAEDGMDDGYPFAITGGRRQVSCSTFKCIDNDGTALNNLKVKAFTKAPINISLQLNTGVAGSVVTVTMNQVQLGAGSLVENGNAFDINFSDSLAHASSPSSVNDTTIAFT